MRLFDRRDTLPAAAAFPAAQWAALTKKEYAQEALSVIWADFISRGLAESGEGFTAAELKVFLRERLAKSIVFPVGQGVLIEPTTPTSRILESLREQAASLSEEELRQAAISAASAPAGLGALLVTLDRVPTVPPDAFVQVGGANGEHQPGLLLLRHEVDVHLEGEPTIADTIEWVCRRFIISAHEQIAWPKMPDFTFRFCWESGRLVFYDNGIYRFELAGNRRDAMSRISRDVGLWEIDDAGACLTPDGRAFLAEVTT